MASQTAPTACPSALWSILGEHHAVHRARLEQHRVRHLQFLPFLERRLLQIEGRGVNEGMEGSEGFGVNAGQLAQKDPMFLFS
jgi:predicted lysophospholipase L1 biosynthesis ABC-type transport system permease subunit